MPPELPLTSERLERHGLFLIEDGQTIFLWVGRDAVPQLVADVFGLPSYEVLRGGKVCSCYGLGRESLIDLLTLRPHSQFLTIPSQSESMLSFKRLEKCDEAFIILISTSLRRMENSRFDSGHSARLSKIAPISFQVTSNSSRHSKKRQVAHEQATLTKSHEAL